MKTEIVSQILNIDTGGFYDLKKDHKQIICNNETWTYHASGLSRDVYISADGKSVIKVPHQRWAFKHNELEFQSYDQAPEWCKDYIAKCELLENGYLIQEYVKVIQANNYYREIGFRESDRKYVIFDCDIFLDRLDEKPKNGFKYEQVFSTSNIFGDAHAFAKAQPRVRRLKQKEAQKKYFPNLENQKLYVTSLLENGISTTIVMVDGEIIDNEVAKECGFFIEY